MDDETMADEEFLDEGEQAEANDPAVGTGTPETAPHETPFDDDDELDPEDEVGTADDDDDIDDGEDASAAAIDDV